MVRSVLQFGREGDPSIIDRIWQLLRSLTDAGIQTDLDTVLHAVDTSPSEPMATIGFCVGARAVYRTMMRLPDRFATGAMWHPSYLVDESADSPHLSADQLQERLFIGIGEDDQMQPLSFHQPFLDAAQPIEGANSIQAP